MGKKYTMYTNTSNVLMVEYKGLMHLVVKLCDVNDDTHRCDLLVISPMTKILLGVDVRDFKGILNLQRRTCLDIYLYVDQIKKVLNTRGKSKVVIDSILTKNREK